MDKSFWFSLCTLIVSILAIIVTNLIAFWSKRLDITQKTNDHKLALRTIYLTNKLKAAENVISHWTVVIRYYAALEQYLGGIDLNNPLHNEFMVPIEAQLTKLTEAVSALSSDGTSLLLYFSVDKETFWSNNLSGKLFAIFARISTLVRELSEIDEIIGNTSNMSDVEKRNILYEREHRMEEFAAIFPRILELIKDAKNSAIALAENLRKQIQEKDDFLELP